jgi:hypothetical protein
MMDMLRSSNEVGKTFGRLSVKWGFFFLFIAVAAACGHSPVSIEDSTRLHLDQVSTRVAEVATKAGIPIDSRGAVTAAHSEGGTAVFVPAPHEDGRIVGWIDLPPTNPCAARITQGYYLIEPHLTKTKANLTLRGIETSSGIDTFMSNLKRKDDDEMPHPTLVRISLGPEHFSVSGWHKCSDGLGCCRWALTLDESTPGCN